MNDDNASREQRYATAKVFDPKPNRAARRRGVTKRRGQRGVALAQKPWEAPTFPQVYSVDKRGKVRGTA